MNLKHLGSSGANQSCLLLSGCGQEWKRSAQQGKWGQIFDLRYLLKLGAKAWQGKGSESETAGFHFPLHCCTLRVHGEEGGPH